VVKHTMNGWKSLPFLRRAYRNCRGRLLFRRLLEPRPSEIERLFDGTRSVRRGKNLLTPGVPSAKRYWQNVHTRACRSCRPCHAPGFDQWCRRRLDERNQSRYVMSPSATSRPRHLCRGGLARFLLASSVDPNFLLVDRLLSFAGAKPGSRSRLPGLRSRKRRLTWGNPLWALDEISSCSERRRYPFRALDRHIDDTTGRIASNRDFPAHEKGTGTSRLVSGYAVTGG